MQYVGETTIPLNKRMNIHRTSKTGCTHVIEHFTNICSHSDMSIQIIEKFDGNGYNASNEIDENMLRIRKDREDTIMKTLRVIYPYGLNEQSKNMNYDGCHVGSLFPPLPRNGDRSKHTHNNRKSESQISLKKFFDDVKYYLSHNIKESFNFIRKLLDSIKKKVLNQIASRIMLQSPEVFESSSYHQCYEYILDIIDTKLFRPTIKKAEKSYEKCIHNTF